MEFITVDVAKRELLGTANANRLRREDQVPAVLYGMKRPNLDLAIARKDLLRFLHTGSHLVELKLGDKARPAILREIQCDHTTDVILHVDFVRVDEDHEVEIDVPLNWHGRAKGESEGGVFVSLKDMVSVRAKPKALPRQYTIEIAELGLDESVTLADVEQREGVTFLEPLDTVLGGCSLPKQEAAAEPDADDGAEPADGAAGDAAADAPAAE